MSILKRFVQLYLSHRAIVALLFLMGVLEVLFVLRTLWPAAFLFILDKHIFEIVVLLSVSQMILLLLKLLERSPRRLCRDEHECTTLVRERVSTDPRAAKLLVFSAGLASRLDLITSIQQATTRPFATEVLAQNPFKALDREDAKRLESNLLILKRDQPNLTLEIRLFDSPATIRGLILCDAKGTPFWGIASWYRYEERATGEISLVGRRNPAFVLDSDSSKEDFSLLEFLFTTFRDLWSRNRDKVAYRSEAPVTQ